MEVRPNFFILGAPKCGTTSIAAWLASHENVYITPVKEPNYFNTDTRIPGRLTKTAYRRLFNAVEHRHRIVGEATTGYLRSRVAVENILLECRDPKFIVCIRNPVEMAYSLHAQRLVEGMESEMDFERAWFLQEERSKGRFLPLACHDPKDLHYGSICLLGSQIRRLFDLVPRSDVLVLSLDEISKSPRHTYLRALRHLRLPDDGQKDFLRMNERRELGGGVSTQIVRYVAIAKNHIPFRLGLRLSERLQSVALVARARSGIPPMIRKMLQEYYYDDVQLLSAILGKDLMNWVIGGDVDDK